MIATMYWPNPLEEEALEVPGRDAEGLDLDVFGREFSITGISCDIRNVAGRCRT
jgi:hypothetical protein